MTSITANIGAKIEAVVTTRAVPDSKVDTRGFARPPVVVEDTTLPAAEAPFIAVAVPPPAIIASDQVTTGSKFARVETITAVPAIAARGMATVSSKLSTQGIKYANNSTTVATPSTITAARPPTHCQCWFSSQTPKYAARLSANRGKKTRNPTDAASPIPRNILIIVSDVMVKNSPLI